MSTDSAAQLPVQVHGGVVLLIRAGDDVGEPLWVAEVPVDGLGDALLEGDGGLPA